VIPAARMKSGREHKVPLAPQAVELLESLYREQNNPFVFIGALQPVMSGKGLRRLLQRLGYGNATPHGTARSGFSDWAHECTAFDNHTIEISIAHRLGSAAEQAYRRGTMMQKRRRLMEVWATYLTTAPAPAKTGTVTPIGAGR
jgi:integrase